METIETDYEAQEIISQADCEKISKEVNVVFHVLASIKFNEDLHNAVQINMINTQKIIKICHHIQNLKSFIHVSTLFSNVNKKQEINEEIYEHALDYRQLIAIAELQKVAEETDKAVTVNFEHDFPNTYTLTKHFAEKIVCDEAKNLPVGIFRPSIVISSYKNLPGWTDNINTAAGHIVGYSMGYGHGWVGRQEHPFHAVPVDFCMNAIIAAAWDVSDRFRNDEKFKVPIYNYAFEGNNINFGEMFELFKLGFHAPLEKSAYYYSFIKTSSKFYFKAINSVLTMFPAYILDAVASIQGKKANNLRYAQKFLKFLDAMSFFTLVKFDFKSKNLPVLAAKVSKMKSYKSQLDFDLRNVDWNDFYLNFLPGIKKYFFKENMNEANKIARSYQRWVESFTWLDQKFTWFHCRKKVLHFTLKFMLQVFTFKKIFDVIMFTSNFVIKK